MLFQPEESPITWRLFLRADPADVFGFIATDAGRARFWAESAVEHNGAIDFVFPGGERWRGRIIACEPPRLYQLVYYGGSITTFTLAAGIAGGTELLLTDAGVPRADRAEVIAGWVSVLMSLKAAVEYGVDLRNHHPERSWAQGYAEN